MPKRKLIALLLLWQVAGGSYLSPAEDEAQLTAWRELDPDAKIIFLRNWTSRGAAHELAHPRRLEMKEDGYCVVDAIYSNETEYKIGKMTIKWVDDHLEYLGTRICDACFKITCAMPT